MASTTSTSSATEVNAPIAFRVTLLHEPYRSAPPAAALRDDTKRWQKQRRLWEELDRLTSRRACP